MFVSAAGPRQAGLKMLFCSLVVKVGRGLFGTICFVDSANKCQANITRISDSLMTSLRDVSDLTNVHPLKR